MTVRQYSLQDAIVEIEQRYRRRTRRSAALHEEAKKFLPGGDTRSATYFDPYPLYIQQGSDCRITDVDGNEYIDFFNNYKSLIHGHAHPRITEAVSRQLAKGTAYAAPLEVQTRLAEVLCERISSLKQVRFCNSGTEATMGAIRAAKAFTGRNKIIKMEGGYHGSHDAAEVSLAPDASLAGPDESPYSVASSRGIFQGVLQDVMVAPFNNIEATSALIRRHRDDLAAVILEPMMGSGGMIAASPEYLRAVRQETESCGALLIFDEVITFRVSYGGAQEVYQVKPDLTALGKIIGGGFPVGAFGGRADIMAQFNPQNRKLSHSGTFNGNAITMVAGLAALEMLTREEIARINQLGERLRVGLRRAFTAAGIDGQVTGIGSMARIHFTGENVVDYRAAWRAAKEMLPPVHLELLNRGIFVAPRCEWAVSTPMGEQEIDAALEAFSATLSETISL
ncbi:MAG TPA: aspartate aminotransferase family protein [Candidatus Angelobacter sp.]|nr:aspartate aminotransferase family protein [Candidatus Angelobacter sp.]